MPSAFHPAAQDGPLPLAETGEGSKGWRPGAHWAKAADEAWLEQRIARKRAKREAIQAEIETLPLHQRPPVRELGRRSESLPHPFRPRPPDESGPPAYDLGGAFWQQGRTLGGLVAREVGNSPDRAEQPQSEAGDDAPLVTTHRSGARIVIAAACPAAQALGLHPGMPLTQARALAPGLDARPADPDGVAADLDRLARHAARHWTPLVAIVPGAGLWLDIGASAHLFGGELAFARRVLRLCRRLRLTARIGIADNAAAAHALATTAGEPLALCPPGGESQALAPLPLRALRIEEETAQAAARLGIQTIGELAALPRAPLARRLGRTMLERLDQALGHRGEPIASLLVEEAPFAERRFAEPIMTAEAIATILRQLADALAQALTERRLGARWLVLTLTRVDAARQQVAIGLARPSRDPAHLDRLLAMRIEEVEPGFGIEAMHLAASHCDPLAPEPVAAPFGDTGAAAEIARLIDRLGVRLGPARLYRAAPVESDVPERSVRRTAPTDQPAGGWRPDWPRPVRIFHPAEHVEGVIALLPDGVPKRFTWRGRSYRVARGDGPERIHGEWWRRPAERDAVRDYFQVEDEEGRRFWLYRRGDALDDRTGDLSWRMQGVMG